MPLFLFVCSSQLRMTGREDGLQVEVVNLPLADRIRTPLAPIPTHDLSDFSASFLGNHIVF